MRELIINIIFILVFSLSLNFRVFAQNPVHLERISQSLELEKFNGGHTFVVDTVFFINEYAVYSVTPFARSFSYCIAFKGNSIVEVKGLRDSYNRIPYQFKLIEVQDKKYFITYWYGETTSYTNISFYVFQVSDSIELKYSDFIYYLDKQENRITETNSFDPEIIGDKLTVRKIKNDPSDAAGFSSYDQRYAEDAKLSLEIITLE